MKFRQGAALVMNTSHIIQHDASDSTLADRKDSNFSMSRLSGKAVRVKEAAAPTGSTVKSHDTLRIVLCFIITEQIMRSRGISMIEDALFPSSQAMKSCGVMSSY